MSFPVKRNPFLFAGTGSDHRFYKCHASYSVMNVGKICIKWIWFFIIENTTQGAGKIAIDIGKGLQGILQDDLPEPWNVPVPCR